MPTTTLHIVDWAEFLNLNGKNQLGTSHCVFLTPNLVLTATTFHSATKAEAFMTHAKTASHLPHPLYGGGALITEAQAEAIAQREDLFPDCTTPEQRLAKAKTLDVCGVARRAGVVHPLMKLHTF
jgi:hypothetical protein